MKIRTVIVDDEPLARERLRALLRDDPELEIIGECSNGAEAIAFLRENPADLLFLDIQMPEVDGFGVLAALGTDRVPAVIFVTAYDKFALKAFEVHALDYLLKPFDRARLRQAVQRVKDRRKTPEPSGLDARLNQLLASLDRAGDQPDRLVVKTDGRIKFVNYADIHWIEAADNYVQVHHGGATDLVRETLGAMEQKLSAKRFLRISRSCIVNVNRIKELQPMFHGDYAVILQDGTRLSLSRSYRAQLEKLMGKGA